MVGPLASGAIMRGDGDTNSRIYRGLRGALARAELVPAAQIRVDETARAYRVSPTPVREVLARLAGERLVDSSRRHGFFVPCPDGDVLADLFALCEIHVLAAIRAAARRGALAPPVGREPGPFLLDLLTQARMPVLVESGIFVLERLALARAVETEVFGPRAQLPHSFPASDAAALGRIVSGYCRRRRAAAPKIARAIAARSSRADEYIPDIV